MPFLEISEIDVFWVSIGIGFLCFARKTLRYFDTHLPYTIVQIIYIKLNREYNGLKEKVEKEEQ